VLQRAHQLLAAAAASLQEQVPPAPRRYVQLDLPTYHAFLALLEHELTVLLPEVAAHLEQSGFEANYFVMKWIMGLFAEDMAKPMVLAVWDLLCQTDLLVLVYVVAAIFHCLAQ
jgi:hypothetical protein